MSEPIEQLTIDELSARVDKLEQEIKWTREMISIIEKQIKNINYEQ
jgi:hypothetical protein